MRSWPCSGCPSVHEDDALRACRAAVEMRDALPELGVQARIGVNTGEVVTGTEERLATGDAVNVAARLEQAAPPGEILLGEATFALVRDAVEAEAVEPLELKGKAEPVAAFRLVAVARRPSAAPRDAPMVGRERELGPLREAFAAGSRRPHAASSSPCSGQRASASRGSRPEFLRDVEPVVRGRCLSYGEGITYWPVVEVLKQLDALPSDPERRGRAPLPARRDGRGDLGRGDRVGVPQAARGAGARRRSSASSTTSTGARRRSST